MADLSERQLATKIENLISRAGTLTTQFNTTMTELGDRWAQLNLLRMAHAEKVGATARSGTKARAGGKNATGRKMSRTGAGRTEDE